MSEICAEPVAGGASLPTAEWTAAGATAVWRPTGFYCTAGKRILDTFLILISAPLWLPLYIFISLGNMLASGFPVHYRCTRKGRNGFTISVLKFRTMGKEADAELNLLSNSIEYGEEFSRYRKMQRDPRVTRFGRVLRRLSLDELPQVWQVLRGEMSLVGPRPVTDPEWVNDYGDTASRVFSIRPGMTGLWQVSGRSLLSYDERVALDLQYVEFCSIKVDLAILFRSISAVVRGRGAF